MAVTAVARFQEQIEALRRQAFDEGYRAAMQSAQEFAANALAPAPAAIEPVARPTSPPRQRREPRRPGTQATKNSAQQSRPASNSGLIEEVLRLNAPRAMYQTEIRSVLQREKGIAMSFTSLRRALEQLKARQAAEQIAGTKTWRHLSRRKMTEAVH